MTPEPEESPVARLGIVLPTFDSVRLLVFATLRESCASYHPFRDGIGRHSLSRSTTLRPNQNAGSRT